MKINYSGGTIPMEWEYVCEDCRDYSIVTHARREDMKHRHCDKCGGLLLRVTRVAPSLDADYHQDQLTRNIGWAR